MVNWQGYSNPITFIMQMISYLINLIYYVKKTYFFLMFKEIRFYILFQLIEGLSKICF